MQAIKSYFDKLLSHIMGTVFIVIILAIASTLIALVGNSLALLLYEGYEWLGDWFQTSVLGIPNTHEIQMFKWVIFGFISIFDGLLAIIWSIPSILAFFFNIFFGFSILFLPFTNDESKGLKRIIDTIVMFVLSAYHIVLLALAPATLFILKTLADKRIEVAETFIFWLEYHVILAISFMAVICYIFSVIFLVQSIMKPIFGGTIGFICGLIVCVCIFYYLYNYGATHAIAYGKDTGGITYWWKLLKDLLEKNAFPYFNLAKKYILSLSFPHPFWYV